MRAVGRPILRYHGGKYRIAPWIISHFPPHRIYVEPYGGAASVLMAKPRSLGEVYNDLDEEVVNVFRVLRDPAAAEKLRMLCHLTPFARAEFELSYEPTDDPVEAARRTIAKSYMGHGSSSRRKHRTGFRGKAFRKRATGPMDWARWPDAIPQFVERLRAVTIESVPALDLIRRHDGAGTLVYADPPYPMGIRTALRSPADIGRAYRHELSDEDHELLADVLRSAKSAVVVSGYRCDLYDRLYAGWAREEKDTIADGMAKRTECLWMNPAARTGRLF